MKVRSIVRTGASTKWAIGRRSWETRKKGSLFRDENGEDPFGLVTSIKPGQSATRAVKVRTATELEELKKKTGKSYIPNIDLQSGTVVSVDNDKCIVKWTTPSYDSFGIAPFGNGGEAESEEMKIVFNKSDFVQIMLHCRELDKAQAVCEEQLKLLEPGPWKDFYLKSAISIRELRGEFDKLGEAELVGKWHCNNPFLNQGPEFEIQVGENGLALCHPMTNGLPTCEGKLVKTDFAWWCIEGFEQGGYPHISKAAATGF